jgi:lipoyl synthase
VLRRAAYRSSQYGGSCRDPAAEQTVNSLQHQVGMPGGSNPEWSCDIDSTPETGAPATGGDIAQTQRRPPWLRVRLAGGGENYAAVRALMRQQALHTVCEEAHCPNTAECWERRTATFLILGDVCTRGCRFCAVTKGKPAPADWDEPDRLAQAVAAMSLRYVVVTSVDRDDLPDGGAGIFAQSIERIRARCPDCSIEVLVPDFQGELQDISTVVAAGPDVFNHNLETVPRLYRRVRPGSRYQRSLDVLRTAHQINPALVTKTGLMVGLGETRDEIIQVMLDARGAGVDILTLGQYLRPSAAHLSIERYYTPDEFAALRAEGLRLGYRHVEAGPLVRSSYHADQQATGSLMQR